MRRVNSSSIILISSCGVKTDDASSASVKWDVYTFFLSILWKGLTQIFAGMKDSYVFIFGKSGFSE